MHAASVRVVGGEVHAASIIVLLFPRVVVIVLPRAVVGRGTVHGATARTSARATATGTVQETCKLSFHVARVEYCCFPGLWWEGAPCTAQPAVSLGRGGKVSSRKVLLPSARLCFLTPASSSGSRVCGPTPTVVVTRCAQ